MMSRDWTIIDDGPSDSPAADAPPADGLDERRIRAIVLDRRAEHRARLRRILVPIACLAVAATAAHGAVAAGASNRIGAAVGVAIALGALWAGLRAARQQVPRAVRAIDAPPLSPPDFSGLATAPSAADRLAVMDARSAVAGDAAGAAVSAPPTAISSPDDAGLRHGR